MANPRPRPSGPQVFDTHVVFRDPAIVPAFGGMPEAGSSRGPA